MTGGTEKNHPADETGETGETGVADSAVRSLAPVPRHEHPAGGRYVGRSTGQGFAFQISLAYSAMVRSLENLPLAATLQMAFCAQAAGSA